MCQILDYGLDFDFSTVLVKGKGKKERYVPFGQFALEALNTYISTMEEKNLIKE